MQKLDTYLHALRRAGHRLTPQRRAICEYLAQTDRHPTPYEIYAAISIAHPEISRATVYNTLNVLQGLGVIVEIALGAEHTHYETDPSPHFNLICLRCHTITDLHITDDEAMAILPHQAAILERSGFQAVSARMDVLGFCAECRARRRAEIVEQWNAHQRQTSDPEPDMTPQGKSSGTATTA